MQEIRKDWTHLNVKMTDIRSLPGFYVFTIEGLNNSFVLTVKDKIFNERLSAYFLKEANKVTRDEILKVSWNLYITKGFYVKVTKNGEIENYEMDPNKHYVSYLEIAGPLATFSSLYKEREI